MRTMMFSCKCRCIKIILQNRTARHLFMLYIATFMFILPFLCSNLQFSIYNLKNMDSKEGRDLMLKENHLRLLEVQKLKLFLQSTKLVQQMKDMKSPIDLAITIITTARNHAGIQDYKPFYLTQIVWKMLWLLYEAQRKELFNLKVSLSICNVDGEPEVHSEAIDLVPILKVINRYEDDKSFKGWNIFEKEKQDYVFCLNSSLVDNAKFVLLVEDDSYPRNDLFVVLSDILNTRFQFHSGLYDPLTSQDNRYKIENVTYIKLYHPERLLSYISFEPDRLTEFFGISMVLGTILMLVYTCCIKSGSHFQKKLIWLSFMIYVGLIVLTIGRPHILSLRRLFPPHFYSFMSAPDCCTPAMLFPRDGARQVVNFLSNEPCYAHHGKDTVLDSYIRTQHRNAYIVQPNLFKHIGFFSSLREKFLNPYVV